MQWWGNMISAGNEYGEATKCDKQVSGNDQAVPRLIFSFCSVLRVSL